MVTSSSSSSSSESEASSSSSSSSSDDDLSETELQQDEETPPPVETPPTLSRSWSTQTVHGPLYTGGTLTCSRHAFLLLPMGGNVVVVKEGLFVDAIRDMQDSNEEEEEGIDANAITAYALSGNDQMIVTCSYNSLLSQYSVHPTNDKETSKMIQFVTTWGKSGHALPVTVMQFHASDIFLATGSVDGTVRIWDVRARFVTHVFRPMAGGGGTLAVTALEWLPDLTTLQVAIARNNGSICIHDLRQKEHIVVLRDHVSAVTCMQWNADCNLFVSTGRDAVINLWRVSDDKKKPSHYQRLHTLPIYEQVEGMAIVASSTSNELVLATAGSKGRIRLWKANLLQDVPRLHLLAEQPESQAFGQDRGGYMQLRYTESNQDDVEPQLVVADAEHNISYVSIKEYSLATTRTIVGHNDDILDLKIIPQTSRIVVATNSAQVRIFDLTNFNCQVLDGHSATVLCVDVSPCGRFVATCGKDKQMRLWRVDTQCCVAVAVGHTEAVGATAFSRKAGRYQVGGKAAVNGGGAFVVTASMDRTLKRWNLPSAADLNELAGQEISLKAFASTRAHDKDINICSVAPNDSFIATGSQDKTVKLWKSTDLALVATLKGHKRGVWDCQFSPFDRVLATGSGDKTVKLWSLSDFSCVRTFQGHVSSVLRVRFLGGGLQLVSSGADGLVKLWTIRTNECETTMDHHTDKVWALDVAGKTLVSGGADSQLVVWQDTTREVEAAKQAEEEEALLLDQRLANHLRHKEYREALDISIGRDKPHQTLKVLTAIIENDIQKGRNGLESLKDHAKSWSIEYLVRVLRYCREWNTRARNCTVALLTIKAIVTSFPADLLASTDGVPEILAGITPYAERHFERLDRLCASSYLLDFCLSSMGSDYQEEEFSQWQQSSRLVLPPKQIDGRTQVGGSAVVGRHQHTTPAMSDSEVITIGESDSDEDMDDT